MKKIFLLLVFLFLHALTAMKDARGTGDLTELPMEELMEVEVITASKFSQTIERAPSAVTVITAEDIKIYGWRSLSEILNSVRGFYISYDRNYNYLGARGFGMPGDYNTRTLFLIDGRRQNDNIYDFASLEILLDLDLIDRIEVVRGPGSSLYGTNAFFSVVNIISKKGKDLDGVSTAVSAGTHNSNTLRATYGRVFENSTDFMLSASGYNSDGNKRLYYGEFDDPSTNNGIAEDLDREEWKNVFLKLSGRNITLYSNYVKREKEVPTASFGAVFNDPRNSTLDEWGYWGIRYDRGGSNGVFWDVYYYWYDYEGDYVYDTPPIVLNKDISRGRWWGGEARFDGTLSDRHRYVIGVEYQNNLRQDQKNFDPSPYMLYLDDRRTSGSFGIYGLGEIAVSDILLFNLGARYDHYSTFGGVVNPRIALIHNPFEDVTVKLVYGEAFRAPNAYESYYNDSNITQKSNPFLNPETIKTYELILEKRMGNVNLLANVFLYDIRGLITLTTDPEDGLLVFKNTSRARAKGVELGLEGGCLYYMKCNAGYTFTETLDRTQDVSLTNSPKHLVKLNMKAPIRGTHSSSGSDAVFLGAELHYTDRRKTLSGARVKDFILTNVTLSFDGIVEGLNVSAGVYNVFDEKYFDPASEEHTQTAISQEGRTFRLKIDYGF